jgi:RNA polymerase sigma-70 factor (ECF subfamily)
MNATEMVWKRTATAQETPVDWDAVYTELLPRIYNYFRYRIGAGPQAEDLTSATFEKAWRNRERYDRDKAAFSTWMFTIARNLATDYFRTRHVHLPLEALEDQAAGDEAVEERVQRGQVSDRLGALLASLPERERELVALKYGAGLTHRESAALTGLSESNVGSILHRTVEKLRNHWEVGGDE